MSKGGVRSKDAWDSVRARLFLATTYIVRQTRSCTFDTSLNDWFYISELALLFRESVCCSCCLESHPLHTK